MILDELVHATRKRVEKEKKDILLKKHYPDRECT